MIYLPLTTAIPDETPVRDEASTGSAAAAVREPPRTLDLPLRVHGAGPAPGTTPRGAASGFFRDPDAFRALAALVPSLFADRGADEAVRVWVAGCAAGEEAWSIAILLGEHAATLQDPPTIQLFATDTDAAGCARGRDALYLASAVAGLPAGRLSRWFAWEGGGYRVAGPLRQAVLFAVHDVLRDPPFDGLDLVVCRNLLPRLPEEARARAVETFHDALRPGGVLFLGAAESAGDDERFVPAAGAQGIYHRGAGPDEAPAWLPAAVDGGIDTADASGSRA
ncbi:MAG TPA: CheR family methyltransferase [Longimicrobium sp.]|nr:CheR family methyltransferase [Longimicrobium sp.]